MKGLSRICILTVAALVSAWSAHAQPVDMGPYFNLDTGRQLLIVELVDEGSGFALDDVHVQTITSLGAGLKGELSYFAPLWGFEDVGLWQELADGHHLLGYIEVDTGDTEYYYPPVGPVDGLMEIGVPVVDEAWVVADGALDRLERLELTLLATGLEYQTAAGLFDDCAAVQADIYVSDTLVQTHYFVWARDVGEILAFEYVNVGGPLVLRAIHITVDVLALP
jgi:hypothetical protein